MYPMWSLGGQINICMACNTFLLMSYHGLDLLQGEEEVLKRTSMDMATIKNWCRRTLAARGVYHFDVAERNMLWCKERNALVLIDFEHAN